MDGELYLLGDLIYASDADLTSLNSTPFHE